MVGRLLEKVLRTLLSQRRSVLGCNKNKEALLASPFFSVNSFNLYNSLHARPFILNRIPNSESDLYRQKTFDKPLSTRSVIKLPTVTQTVNMGSSLEMKSKLSKRNRKSLGPLMTKKHSLVTLDCMEYGFYEENTLKG